MVTCFACKIRLLLMEKAKIVLKGAKYHHNIYGVFSYRYMVTSFALFYFRRISSTSIKIRLLSMEKAKIVFKKAKYHFNIYIFSWLRYGYLFCIVLLLPNQPDIKPNATFVKPVPSVGFATAVSSASTLICVRTAFLQPKVADTRIIKWHILCKNTALR